MTAYPAWTPASRPGIVPLHPLSFGTILGRSFVALRQNPRVLLGFALVVQTVAFIVILVAIGAISVAAFSRLDTLRPGTEEFETVLAGSVALTIVAGFVLSLAATALTVIVQAVVVVEVSHAVVAEKSTLGALWRQVKPVAWRVIGWAFLVGAAVLVTLALLAGLVIAIGVAVLPLGIVLGILLFLGMIPLYWWLTIKLLLVPAAILMERATIRGAIRRSWLLTRTRFWASLGVIILIGLIFGAVGQVVSLPFSFLSAGLGTIISPTGENEATYIIGMLISLVLTYAVALLIQSIAIVVQSTATALIYVDCRMRHEGLDLDLLEYVEKRDAGGTDLPDPYQAHIGRNQPSPYRPPTAGYPAYPGYPAGGPQAYPPPQPGSPPAPGYPPQQPAPGYAAPGHAPYPAQPAPPPAAPPAAPPSTPPAAPTQWTAPGAPPSEAG